MMIKFKTIKEYLYWIYANIALAHVALKNNHINYERTDYMIRAKLFKGLCTGTMNIASLYDDEKEKLKMNICCYCGAKEKLTLDHLIPKKLCGSDTGDNLVYACQKCNSSKNAKDLIEWALSKDRFPPILLLRRYMKLVISYCEKNRLLDEEYNELIKINLPFRLELLPYDFPEPNKLEL